MHKFAYSLDPAVPVSGADESHRFVEGVNIDSGLSVFRTEFGGLTSLERDLLHISAIVFAADRASPRGEREQYRRFIEVRIPVFNYELFLSHASNLTRLLRKLSQDVWNVNFVPAAADPSDQSESSVDFTPSGGKTLLFSGGLDSLAGAFEFGNDTIPLLLSSHITRNPATDGSQRELAKLLSDTGLAVEHKQFFVSSRDGGPTNLQHQREASQRTRSLVFLTLGVLSSRRTRRLEVVSMAENGQMAIHLPLSSARIGAFSTHTAHPSVLKLAQDFFQGVLGYPIVISNPYVYRTKAEVVHALCHQLPTSIPMSTSCWKNSRPMQGGARHCGECVPCLVRRIALETHGPDPTLYGVDLLNADVRSLPPESDGRRNLADLCEFVSRFRDNTDDDLCSEFPEIISPHFSGQSAIEMYRRFSTEAQGVLSNYPQLSWLL